MNILGNGVDIVKNARIKKAIKTKSAWLLTGTSARDYLAIFQKIYNSGLKPNKRINLLDFFDTREYTQE